MRALVGCFQWDVLPAVGLVERDCLDFLQVGMACARPHHDFVRSVTLIQLVVQPDCNRRQRHLKHTDYSAGLLLALSHGLGVEPRDVIRLSTASAAECQYGAKTASVAIVRVHIYIFCYYCTRVMASQRSRHYSTRGVGDGTQ